MNGMQERGRPWNSAGGIIDDQDDAAAAASWKDFGTSMSAISLGFAATAILISMFIIMAIFERLIKPRTASLFRSTNHPEGPSSQSERAEDRGNTSSRLKKLAMPTGVGSWCTTDLSVLMPGHHYPTFIAQPAPLPCSREGILWPSHDHTHDFVL